MSYKKVFALVLVAVFSIGIFSIYHFRQKVPNSFVGSSIESSDYSEVLPSTRDLDNRNVANDLKPSSVVSLPLSHSVSMAFESAHNYRTLYEGLLQRGAEGGGYYALRILLICSLVRTDESILATPSISREQDASRQLLNERCSSFSTAELDNQLGTLNDPRLKADPLEQLSRKFLNDSEDPAKRTGLIQEILETQDPLLIENMAHRLFRSNAVAVFGGQRFGQPNAGEILAAAWQSAACVLSGTCGVEDPTVVNACALRGLCFQDREATLRDEVERNFGLEGAALFDSVQSRMKMVIKDKDASALKVAP